MEKRRVWLICYKGKEDVSREVGESKELKGEMEFLFNLVFVLFIIKRINRWLDIIYRVLEVLG